MDFTVTGPKSAQEEDRLSKLVLDAAFRVHSAIGPGLLESAYEACLAYELRNEELSVITQVPLPLVYREVRLEVGYRLDSLVEDLVVVEIKSVDFPGSNPSRPSSFLLETQPQKAGYSDQFQCSSPAGRDQAGGKRIVIPLFP